MARAGMIIGLVTLENADGSQESQRKTGEKNGSSPAVSAISSISDE